MARASYDDWNFMGEVHTEEQRVRGTRSGKNRQLNSQRNSFIFICIVILLTLMGLVCVYSASFEMAVNDGLPHYHYLMMQAIYVGIRSPDSKSCLRSFSSSAWSRLPWTSS